MGALRQRTIFKQFYAISECWTQIVGLDEFIIEEGLALHETIQYLK